MHRIYSDDTSLTLDPGYHSEPSHMDFMLVRVLERC
jgi:hypothetical protein